MPAPSTVNSSAVVLAAVANLWEFINQTMPGQLHKLPGFFAAYSQRFKADSIALADFDCV
jgi:hypothetical protein